ncbi:MAG: glycosyltransferase [Erysipelotrichaceae bacterium]
MNLISIIIPVYNSENYLEKCIDSIIEQHDLAIEIIIINDGSTDRSADICIEYKKKYSFVKYIESKNNGVSTARNIGLGNSTGKWVMFVDADDMLYRDALVNMRKQIDENYDAIYMNYDRTMNISCDKIRNVEIIDSEDLIKLTLAPSMNKHILKCKNEKTSLLTTSWGKLFKKDIIDEYEVKFNSELKLSEDTMFNLDYLSHAKKVKFVDCNIYFYRDNLNSVTRNLTNNYIDNQGDLIKHLSVSYSDNMNIKTELNVYIINNLIGSLIRVAGMNTKSGKQEIKKMIKNNNIPHLAKSVRNSCLSSGRKQNLFNKSVTFLWSKKCFALSYYFFSIYQLGFFRKN